jgi:hypothetical protein
MEDNEDDREEEEDENEDPRTFHGRFELLRPGFADADAAPDDDEDDDEWLEDVCEYKIRYSSSYCSSISGWLIFQ